MITVLSTLTSSAVWSAFGPVLPIGFENFTLVTVLLALPVVHARQRLMGLQQADGQADRGHSSVYRSAEDFITIC